MSAAPPPPVLSLRDVGATLGGRPVVEAANLSFVAGERVALIGPNGAGKSTLLKRMAGLMHGPGEVRLGANDLAGVPVTTRARHIAYLPQQRQIGWPIRVRDLVALGRVPHGADPLRPGIVDGAAIERAMQALEVVQWADRPATALSQGEQARVLVARALATEADILLADEPVAALDPRHQLEMLGALAAESHAGRLVVVVLHDLALAAEWASRIVLMVEGRILADGLPHDVLQPELISRAFGIQAEVEAANNTAAHRAPLLRFTLPRTC